MIVKRFMESLDYNYDNNSLYDIINIENLDKETLIDLKQRRSCRKYGRNEQKDR